MNRQAVTPWTNRRRRFLYVGFLCTLVLIALLLTELLVLPAKYWPVPRAIQLMGFHAPPGEMIFDVRINSLGFTGDTIERAKPQGTIRILTLGASTMFNRRMTVRLAARLKQVSRRPVELLGAALPSHTTVSSVLKYRVLADYDFDYVLIYHGINDLLANHVPPEDFSPAYTQINPWYRRGPLLDRSLLARWIVDGWVEADRLATLYPNTAVENLADYAAAPVFEDNLRALICAARRHGATPILMSFAYSIPDHYTQDAFWKDQIGYNNPQLSYDPCPAELWGSVPYVREGLRRHNARIRRIATETGVLFLDQQANMGEDLKWFGDVCHFSDIGTDRFISYIADFFQAKRLLEAGSHRQAAADVDPGGSRR